MPKPGAVVRTAEWSERHACRVARARLTWVRAAMSTAMASVRDTSSGSPRESVPHDGWRAQTFASIATEWRPELCAPTIHEHRENAEALSGSCVLQTGSCRVR